MFYRAHIGSKAILVVAEVVTLYVLPCLATITHNSIPVVELKATKTLDDIVFFSRRGSRVHGPRGRIDVVSDR